MSKGLQVLPSDSSVGCEVPSASAQGSLPACRTWSSELGSPIPGPPVARGHLSYVLPSPARLSHVVI